MVEAYMQNGLNGIIRGTNNNSPNITPPPVDATPSATPTVDTPPTPPAVAVVSEPAAEQIDKSKKEALQGERKEIRGIMEAKAANAGESFTAPPGMVVTATASRERSQEPTQEMLLASSQGSLDAASSNPPDKPDSPAQPVVSKKEKEIEDSKEDRLDIFPELEVIFIGKHSFNRDDIIKNFDTEKIDKTHLVPLFMKIFQNKYPFTRSRGLPKIPSKKTDKELLIKALSHYFNNQRKEIILSRKREGNSIVLRERIGHLGEIRILLDHFENDKDKFPYHLFREYLSNADYYSSQGDIHEQLIKNRKRGDEDTRIRNLLRQFAKLYLLQEGDDEITISQPGVTKEDFQQFRKSIEGSIPAILISLIDLIEGKTKEIATEKGEDINYEALYKLLSELSTEFEDIKEKKTPEPESFATVGGNPFPIDKKKPIDKSVEGFVKHLFGEYTKLKESQRQLITSHSGELSAKDLQHSQEINKLELQKDDAERNVAALASDVKKFLEYQKTNTKQIDKLNGLITKLRNIIKETAAAKSKCSTELENLKESTDSEAKSKAASLLQQKQELDTQISDKTAELAAKEAEIAGLTAANAELQAGKTAAQEQLAAAEASIGALATQVENMVLEEDYIKAMAAKDAIIGERDAAMSKMRPEAEVTSRNTTISELRSGIAALEEENAALQSSIDRITGERDDAVGKFKGLTQNYDALKETLQSFKNEIAGVMTNIEGTIQSLRDNLAAATAKDKEQQADIARLRGQASQVAGLLAINQELSNTLTGLRAELAAKTAELVAAQTSSSELKGAQGEEITAKQEEIAAKQEEIDGLKDEIAAKAGQIASQKLQLDRLIPLEQKSIEKDAQIEALRSELEQTAASYRALLGKQASDASLQSQLADATAELEMAGIALGEKTEAIGALTSRLTELQAANRDLVGKNKDCDEAKKNLSIKEKALKEVGVLFEGQQDAFNKSFAEKVREVTAAQAELATAKAELEESELLVTALTNKIPELTSALARVSGQNEELKRELEELKQRYTPKISLERSSSIRMPQAESRSVSRSIYGPSGVEYRDPSRPTFPTTWNFGPTVETRVDKSKQDLAINSILSTPDRNKTFQESVKMFVNTYNSIGADEKEIKNVFFLLSTIFRFINIVKTEEVDNIKKQLNQIHTSPDLSLSGTFNNFLLTLKQNTNRYKRVKQQAKEVLQSFILLIPDNYEQQAYNSILSPLMRGGGSKDPLYKYSIKIADNRLNEFLTKQPLPFASLITDFEKSSNLSVVRETNEKHMLEEFVIYQLRKWFEDDKMKEFFYEFNKLFEKMNFIEMAKFCMSIYEICNVISRSEDTIDVARLESKEYNGLIDEIQNLLKACQFDFYEVASKEIIKTKLVDIKYNDNHIYFKRDTHSSEHTYSIDDHLKLSKKTYDYNEDIYTINNKVIYFFFILSTYNVIKKDIRENDTVQELLKNTRTLKRNYKKSAKVRWQTKLT